MAEPTPIFTADDYFLLAKAVESSQLCHPCQKIIWKFASHAMRHNQSWSSLVDPKDTASVAMLKLMFQADRLIRNGRQEFPATEFAELDEYFLRLPDPAAPAPRKTAALMAALSKCWAEDKDFKKEILYKTWFIYEGTFKAEYLDPEHEWELLPRCREFIMYHLSLLGVRSTKVPDERELEGYRIVWSRDCDCTCLYRNAMDHMPWTWEDKDTFPNFNITFYSLLLQHVAPPLVEILQGKVNNSSILVGADIPNVNKFIEYMSPDAVSRLIRESPFTRPKLLNIKAYTQNTRTPWDTDNL